MGIILKLGDELKCFFDIIKTTKHMFTEEKLSNTHGIIHKILVIILKCFITHTYYKVIISISKSFISVVS